jgi:hypothetical protein
MLNIGSSTGEFREVTQPFIDVNIFKPFRERGGQVLHVDQRSAPGVGMVGDIGTEELGERLRSVQAKLILCSNVLEYVKDVPGFCRLVESIGTPGGLILVTVPLRYPYHKDPIDSLLRLSPDQLGKMSSQCRVLQSNIVISEDSYAAVLQRNPRYAALMAARMMLPIYKFDDWWKTAIFAPEFFTKFQASC